jgi:phenylalanyl-tRNA synthetase beta chain
MLGAQRAAQLLVDAGATVGPLHILGPAEPAAPSVTIEPGDVERLLGFTVDRATIERSLRALGFATTQTPDGIGATPPYWRGDIAIAADYVEEIARIVGYDRVVATVPSVAPQAIDSDAFDRETELAQQMVALGYTEALSLSLQSAATSEQWRKLGIAIGDVVEIRNPLSEDQRFMRFSLFPALLEFAARDRAVRPYRSFELGRVFTDARPDPHEAVHLSALHAGGAGAFGRLKSDLLLLVRRATGRDARLERGTYAGMHPGKCAALRVDETIVAYVGVVDPRLAGALDLADTTAIATLFVAALPPRAVATYAAPSRFPAVERDLAVIVADDVLAGDVVDAVRSEPLVRIATVFDEYRGPQIGDGKKSLTLRVTLQSATATLTDGDADAAIARIVDGLHARVAAVLRS